MYEEFVRFVRGLYNTDDFIPLHEPRFIGNEKNYLLKTIDSTYVSSVGEYVNRFEDMVSDYTGSKYAIAIMNGTSALHISLLLAGVQRNDEVITQSLTFIATCNAIRYCGAEPVFIDIDRNTLGMSPESLAGFLDEYADVGDDGVCRNRHTGSVIRACLPMNTFGHPVNIDEIKKLCDKFCIELIEDAAESLGSFYDGVHTGTVSKLSALSFNGNKIITTGGGGMILTNDESLAKQAKHITTTSKIEHQWQYEHDEIGFNYRMPNLNAALGVAQMESLQSYVLSKRKLADQYKSWCGDNDIVFVNEPMHAKSNYWLNAILLDDAKQRDEFLNYTNSNNVMTRPVWVPMHKLVMYKHCQNDGLSNTLWYADRLVNVPSSVAL